MMNLLEMNAKARKIADLDLSPLHRRCVATGVLEAGQ
jgi:hypothetical protein